MVKRKKPKGAADQLSELVVDVVSGDMPIVMVIRADKGKNPAADVLRRMKNIKGKKVRSARPVHRRVKSGAVRGSSRRVGSSKVGCLAARHSAGPAPPGYTPAACETCSPLNTRCTVPAPTPSLAAIARTDRPFAFSLAILAITLASVRGAPSLTPLALALARPAFTRSRIIARSNSAKTPIIWKRARPAGVVVSTACWWR